MNEFDMKRHVPQVTPHQVQLCPLHAVHTAPGATDGSSAQATSEGAPELRLNPKRHASWTHLSGMEDRISDALARQRFLRPRCVHLPAALRPSTITWYPWISSRNTKKTFSNFGLVHADAQHK